MEDSELTRKAIEELLKEMDECKEKERMPLERKKNPLGRPNKLFLGRTINSIMTHNKRQSDRTLKRCERKIKELNAKQRKHNFRKHVKLEKPYETISSDSYEEGSTNKTSKKIKRKNKRRNKKHRSQSPSSTSSSSSSNINLFIQSKNRNRREINTMVVDKEYKQDFYDCNNDSTMGYVNPNITYAIMAYSQMNHMICQQQLVQQIVKKDLEHIDIPSDLSLSCRSTPESSLNISLHSSSAEEDENGILTFKLSSDDENKVRKKSTEINNERSRIDRDESDVDSAHSHITLGSNDSQSFPLQETNEIYSLISSSTDSDEIEIIKTTCNIFNLTKADGNIKENSSI